MERKPSLLMICLGYGVIVALAMIVLNLVLFLLELEQNKPLQFLSYVILLAGIILSQFNYRSKYSNGYIDYGKAFMVGMLTSLFLAIIMGIYTFIFFKFIDPGALGDVMSQTEQELMDRGMTDMEIEQGLMVASKFQSVEVFALFAFLGNFIIGMIISLITAIFVKKEDNSWGQPAA